MRLPDCDDSDMKIAGGVKKDSKETFDALALIEDTRIQRFNGNMTKAKTLGSNIVSAFSYKAAPDEIAQLASDFGVTLDDTVLLQMKVLSVFSAEYCMENYLPSAMLSSVAVNAMYDVLMDISPSFYRELSASMAFSFYYLCVRRGEDIAAAIGERFAMLCGEPTNAAYAALGRKLHEINMRVYRRAIDSFAFV